MDQLYDIIIVGGGPAGLSAALYSSRSNANTLIIENGAPGGKLLNTDLIENYPGYTSINGAELALNMLGHATSFNANIISDKVINVTKVNNVFSIKCENANYNSKAVIIASGSKSRLLNIPGEIELTGKGVSYCAVCDAPFYKNKDVAIIGGGNSALEEAIYLSKFAKTVHLIVRRDVFRGDPIYVNKVNANDKIKIHFNSVPIKINSIENKVSSLTINNNGNVEQVEVSGIFPFIGNIPVSKYVDELGITNEEGYIKVNNEMETTVAGLYAAGDIIVKNLRQVVTAASDGAIAGQNAVKYINKNS